MALRKLVVRRSGLNGKPSLPSPHPPLGELGQSGNTDRRGPFVLSSQFLVVLFFAIHAVNIGGILANWQRTFTWLDNGLHFAGGLWVGLVFFALVQEYAASLHTIPFSRVILPLFALSFVALVGVAWEFFEFGLDRYVSTPRNILMSQPSIADTMSDLFLDLVGGAFAVIVGYVRRTRK